MQPVLELIAKVGPSDANVLITGEHGTGKEVLWKCVAGKTILALKEEDTTELDDVIVVETEETVLVVAKEHSQLVGDLSDLAGSD